MKRVLFKLSAATLLLLGLPMAGILLAGRPIGPYLEFPPESRFVIHARFRWPVFFGYGIFILAVTVPLLVRGLRASASGMSRQRRAFPWPWWGTVGLVAGALFWFLAWNRFPWFSPFQPHTFTPLWLSFILVVNALSRCRTGRCPMTEKPLFFILLFPVSAAFWWFFEYLNRFVQNWFYTGVHYGAMEYFVYASLSFSTVLPALLSTRDLIAGSGRIGAGFQDFLRIRPARPRILALMTLSAAAAGLFFIGIAPNLLFPLVWISPLLILVGIEALAGDTHILSGIAKGDWTGVLSSALAALLCGFFWEMWNFFSLARWHYSVPYVARFSIFEMPLLGYAGYLPFGLECAAVGRLLENLFPNGGRRGRLPVSVPPAD